MCNQYDIEDTYCKFTSAMSKCCFNISDQERPLSECARVIIFFNVVVAADGTIMLSDGSGDHAGEAKFSG